MGQRENPQNDWCRNYDNVVWLGSHLLEWGFSAVELQRYYEKPWKWGDEFRRLKAGHERGEEWPHLFEDDGLPLERQ